MTVRTQVLALAVLIALLALIDFSTRVHVGRDASLRRFEVPPAVRLPLVDTAAAARQRLTTWLPSFAGAQVVQVDPADPTAWNFALLGIFGSRDRLVALLAASPASGGTREKAVRMGEGDSLHGWTVSHVDRRGITLQNGGETRQLVLFRRGGQAVPGVPASPR